MFRIGTILGAGIGILLALCVTIGLVSASQTRIVREKVEEMTRVKEPASATVAALETHVMEGAFSALGYLTTGDSALLHLFRGSTERADSAQRLFSVQAAESTAALVNRLGRFHALARDQIALRDRQAGEMERLLTLIDDIDALLAGRISAAVTADDPIAYRRLQAALGMQSSVNAITKALGSYLLTGRSRFAEAIRDAESDFQSAFALYRNVVLSSEEKQWAADLGRLSEDALRRATTIVDLENERSTQLTAFLGTERELRQILNDHFQRRTSADLAAAKTDLLDAGERANATILIVLLLSVAFGGVAGVVTTRSITGALRQLAAAMHTASEGDAVEPVRLHAPSELRALGESFNVMIRRLRKAHDDIEEAQRRRSADLRRFAGSVQRAQEEERRRISRELHDDLSQRLSGMKFAVEALDDDLGSEHPKVARRLRTLGRELDRSITEVRRISSNLRPSALDDFGLVSALRLLCREFQERFAVETRCDAADDPALQAGPDAETALFRIAQEALSNVAKHARASRVLLRLTRHEDALELRVEDDGAGFPPDGPLPPRTPGHGLGIVSMRERAELLGGTCTIASAPGTGTTVTITLPIDRTSTA
jgi:signal transduction histidine kinase